MKKLSVALLALIALALFAAPGQAAFISPATGVVYLLKDTGGTTLPYAAEINAVKLSNTASGKYYRLHVGTSSSGAVIWEHINDTAATTSPLTLSPPADNITFTVPSSGVYFDTDDTGLVKLFLYYNGSR